MPKIICLLNDVFNIKTCSLREEKSIEHCDIGFSNITVVYIKELEYFLCFTEIKEKKEKLYCFKLHDILPKFLCY